MKLRLKCVVVLAFILLLSSQLFTNSVSATPSNSASIFGKVVDAKTGLPIENATVLLWDITTLQEPKLGAGIYFTDENGAYNISSEYLQFNHTYRIYTYKGDFEAKTLDYVPSVNQFTLSPLQVKNNISFFLTPGALVELEGTLCMIQSSPGVSRIFIKVLSETELNTSFVNECGDSNDA